MVVCFVTGQMVGDRRFPGATILGARSCTPSANHPVSVPPTGPEHSDASFCGQCTRLQVVHIQMGSLSGLQFTTMRRLCGQLLPQQQKGQHPEGVAGPLFLGSKKQKVVNIVTDGWLATAGLRGG